MKIKKSIICSLVVALACTGLGRAGALPSTPNTLTRVAVSNAVFTAFCGGEEWDAFTSTPRGGISLRRRADGTLTFIGWVTTRDGSVIRGRWVELANDAVTPAEQVAYDVVIESDYRCVPLRVRYLVNGHALADSLGNTWFSMRAVSLNPAVTTSGRVSSISFVGEGSWGSWTVETEGVPTPRATVAFDRVMRQKPGVEIAPSVTPLEGVTLGTSLTYRWYLVDAAGMAVEGSERGTGAKYALAAADAGHWVAVDVADENGFLGTGRMWASDLPIVYINCESNAWPTAQKEEHNASIAIAGNATYKAQYDKDGTADTDGTILMSTIHVRGNSTAGADKKPYKIKLGKKADLFGFGKNKHWVLLANCFDESLMRNKISYDLSAAFGLVAMKSEWVDVVMNGKYVGNYLLCQHIRVGEDRINIAEWSEDDITGGYIFELDAKKAGASASAPAVSQCAMTRKSSAGSLYLPLAMNTPEECFALASVSNYVCTYWADVLDAWLSTTGTNSKGQHYSDLCDFDSMVGYWLALYVPGNDDAASYSRYAYKDCGGKLVFGPAWDYDYGLGSLQIRIRSAVVTNAAGDLAYAPIQPEKWIPARGSGNFVGHWTSDPYFSLKLREKYLAVRDRLDEVVRTGGLIDQYAEKLEASARANDLRWNNRIGFFGNDHEAGDVAVLKEFLSRRFQWLDGQFARDSAEPLAALTNLTETVAASALRYKATGNGKQVPAGVKAGWARQLWQKLAAADPAFAARTPPTTQDGWLAFANGPSPLGKTLTPWEDYVAGTDPTDAASEFSASIDMVDGLPHIAWTPDLREREDLLPRTYTLWGTESLSASEAAWESLQVDDLDAADAQTFLKNHSFFKVEVALPTEE